MNSRRTSSPANRFPLLHRGEQKQEKKGSRGLTSFQMKIRQHSHGEFRRVVSHLHESIPEDEGQRCKIPRRKKGKEIASPIGSDRELPYL